MKGLFLKNPLLFLYYTITNIKIENFKSLKNIDLELRSLNLLTGLNGSGKSSLIQALLILRQSKNKTRDDSMRELSLNGDLFEAGTGKDIYHKKSLSSSPLQRLYFGVAFLNNDPLSAATIGLDHNILGAEEAVILFDNNRNLDIGWLTKHSLFNDNFQYLFAERKNYSDSYKISVEEVINKKTLGKYGEHTAFYLKTFGKDKEIKNAALHHPKAKSTNLIDQANAWLSEISPNTNIETFIENEGNVALKYKQGDNLYKPKHVGFGLSYVLPVIVTLLTAEEDKLIIMENPEAHIHPRGQAELGRLLAACSETKAQLIIETHSDHILNGVRLATKEKLSKPENIITHYFRKNEVESNSEITSIILDEKGKLYSQTAEGQSAELPQGFFDEWANTMFKLV